MIKEQGFQLVSSGKKKDMIRLPRQFQQNYLMLQLGKPVELNYTILIVV